MMLSFERSAPSIFTPDRNKLPSSETDTHLFSLSCFDAGCRHNLRAHLPRKKTLTNIKEIARKLKELQLQQITDYVANWQLIIKGGRRTQELC